MHFKFYFRLCAYFAAFRLQHSQHGLDWSQYGPDWSAPGSDPSATSPCTEPTFFRKFYESQTHPECIDYRACTTQSEPPSRPFTTPTTRRRRSGPDGNPHDDRRQPQHNSASPASCAFCAASATSDAFLRPQHGLTRIQRGPCSLSVVSRVISQNPTPQPSGVRVTYSTVVTHRPVDYSPPCGLLTTLWITHRPVDYSPPCGLLTALWITYRPVDYSSPRGLLTTLWITHRPVDYSPPCGLLTALWITYRPVDYSSPCGLLTALWIDYSSPGCNTTRWQHYQAAALPWPQHCHARNSRRQHCHGGTLPRPQHCRRQHCHGRNTATPATAGGNTATPATQPAATLPRPHTAGGTTAMAVTLPRPQHRHACNTAMAAILPRPHTAGGTTAMAATLPRQQLVTTALHVNPIKSATNVEMTSIVFLANIFMRPVGWLTQVHDTRGPRPPLSTPTPGALARPPATPFPPRNLDKKTQFAPPRALWPPPFGLLLHPGIASSDTSRGKDLHPKTTQCEGRAAWVRSDHLLQPMWRDEVACQVGMERKALCKPHDSLSAPASQAKRPFLVPLQRHRVSRTAAGSVPYVPFSPDMPPRPRDVPPHQLMYRNAYAVAKKYKAGISPPVRRVYRQATGGSRGGVVTLSHLRHWSPCRARRGVGT
ncbi:hypothetical protein GWK47_044204 [Chionoecetes opilio]|uniref:Uncharacterized protein n=1 Tax=Chionoecetes opilio TaxID=41210 RepID=A0A8J4YE80_CHIOP|nr:hypothetical protein GWK47_044204 [Chionoecetes opilio]